MTSNHESFMLKDCWSRHQNLVFMVPVTCYISSCSMCFPWNLRRKILRLCHFSYNYVFTIISLLNWWCLSNKCGFWHKGTNFSLEFWHLDFVLSPGACSAGTKIYVNSSLNFNEWKDQWPPYDKEQGLMDY